MKIFLVDDDNDAMEGLVETLEEIGGHSVTKVSTVHEAEAEFSAPKWGYDLLIIDVEIRPVSGEKTTPEASLIAGLSLLRKFRSRFERAKVLILTNNLHRVPLEMYSGKPDTRARDKVDVSGRRILDAIRNW